MRQNSLNARRTTSASVDLGLPLDQRVDALQRDSGRPHAGLRVRPVAVRTGASRSVHKVIICKYCNSSQLIYLKGHLTCGMCYNIITM